MNSSVISPAMGKLIGQSWSLNLGKATSLGEGKLGIQTIFIPLKNWSHVTSCL